MPSDDLQPSDHKSSIPESMWREHIAREAYHAIMRMKPNESVTVRMHEPRVGSPLFEITFTSPTGGPYG